MLTCGLLCLPACTPDSIGRTYPVRGKVYLDGELLKAGSVGFFPAEQGEHAPAYEAAGRIKPDGTYELSTRGKPGALRGNYKVTVALQTKVEPHRAGDAVSLVPKEYASKETTPLKVEVVEKPDSGHYDLRMSSNRE